ncbi:trypsin-like serine peptidase [Sorangium sp. So ce1000]|uniref:trypsin-like serine peptidase n=1 Tax=Sorangium sp. So ce1000 TaxID=3133325 RepID=UPI003F646C14
MRGILRGCGTVLLAAGLLLAPGCSGAPSASAAAASIDGEDNRTECGSRQQCDAVALLVHRDVVSTTSGDSVTLRMEPYSSAHKPLCAWTRFADQPVISSKACTGFLVGRDVLATAGHCVLDKNLEDLRVVFGYRMLKDNRRLATISQQQVYRVARPCSPPRYDSSTHEDWALLQLDRPVSAAKPLPIERTGTIGRGDQVFMIGHPLGLPLKHVDNAFVRDASKEFSFNASLDAFHANSGSPVFNEAGEVVGLLAGGTGADHVWHEHAGRAAGEGCWEEYTCDPKREGCNGKRVTRSSAFASKVQGCASQGTPAEPQ